MLKGGTVDVPEKCKVMANAALSQLAYYAGAHVDVTNVAIEELLARYNGGANLGGPLPGMEGLTPFKRSWNSRCRLLALLGRAERPPSFPLSDV